MRIAYRFKRNEQSRLPVKTMPEKQREYSSYPSTFKDALRILNIEDFHDRIFYSNSHGELFHCYDYMQLARLDGDKEWFRPWFLSVVEAAQKNWERPESVFQHIVRILQDE